MRISDWSSDVCSSDLFRHISGPDRPLPQEGMISIVGPGTGLGVAQLLRRKGRNFVSGTEGGHIDFAPLDELEVSMLGLLRSRYRRASVERLIRKSKALNSSH